MDQDASGYASQLVTFARQALERAGHVDCPLLTRGRYIAESGAVMCGCGVFTEAPITGEVTTDDGSGTVRPGPGGSLEYEPRDPIAATLALIDPTQVYTPEEVERHILETLYRLETGALFERQAIERAHRAADAWDRAYWRAYHLSDATSEGKRKAEAMVACDDAGLSREKMEAEMVAAAVKATMHNLRSVLSGYQSVAKSVGLAYNLGGSPGRF